MNLNDTDLTQVQGGSSWACAGSIIASVALTVQVAQWIMEESDGGAQLSDQIINYGDGEQSCLLPGAEVHGIRTA